MKILVTGGCGYLGTILVKKLLNNKSFKLDEKQNNSISVDNLNIKTKLKKILNITRDLKKLK